MCSILKSCLIGVIGLLLVLCGIANSGFSGRAVVGIDYGTTNVRMGMLRSGVGSVEIVLSLESDRKTINAVAYREESSIFSQTAMNMFPKFPKAVFYRLYKLLGKSFDSPSVSEYRETFVHRISEDPDRKTVLIADPIQGDMIPVEQIAGMFFSHLMDQAEKHAGFKVVDCVISVPSYFNHFERQAVLDSAKIAGFNVLSLVNSVSAAALFKTTMSNDITTVTNFIIYDSGSGGTSAALVSIDPSKVIDGITAKSVEIKGLESDSGLGGDLIDDRIASYLISKFEAAHPGVIISSGKPRNKVLIEAARIKKILNANDHVSASLEDLVEEYSLNITISREEIDKLLLDLSSRFTAPISNLLSNSNTDISQISSILLIGGNSRNQFLLKALKKAFGSEKLSVTLDPDEATVKGTTLYSAKLHPAFRLRPTHFIDIYSSAVYVQYQESGNEGAEMKKVDLFPSNTPLQTRKGLSLKKMNSVNLNIFNSRDDKRIAHVSVNGLKDALSKFATNGKSILSSKMRVPVFLSSSGQVVVETPIVIADYEEEISKNVYKTHTKSVTETTQVSGEGKETVTEPSSSMIPEQHIETQTIKEKVKKTHNISLEHEISYEIPAMTPQSIQKSQAILKEIRDKENEQNLLANARNDLEKSLYRVQGQLSNVEFLEYTSNTEKSELKSQIGKVSKFLSEDTIDKTVASYQKNMLEFTKIEDLVKFRQHEEQERSSSVEKLQKKVNEVIDYCNSQKTSFSASQRPQTDEDLDNLLKKAQETSKWLIEKSKKQHALKKSDNPLLLCSDLEVKLLELNSSIDNLQSKKMPVTEAKPSPSSASVGSNNDNKQESNSEKEALKENISESDANNQILTETKEDNDKFEDHFDL